MNGLRINEALGAGITELDHDRGHRTLNIVRKGGNTSPSRSHHEPGEPSTSTSGNEPAGPCSSG